jgi:hypothetical protein
MKTPPNGPVRSEMKDHLKKLWKITAPLVALGRLILFLVELAHHL